MLQGHLRPEIHTIVVPGTKTAASAGTAEVEVELWPWIEAAIPAPVKYKQLRRHWHKACDNVGVAGVTIHDLRHVYGQKLTDENLHESKIQVALRHRTPHMTRRYTMQRSRGEAARTIGKLLLEARDGALRLERKAI